jgi:hypothetical protein
VAELIALARKEPNRIDYASSGNGSAQHLVGALFITMANAPMNHVPYKGSSQAMNDVLGGQVKVTFAGVPNVLPNLHTGKLRALAVSTKKRYPELPDVPTLEEAGSPGLRRDDLARPSRTARHAEGHRAEAQYVDHEDPLDGGSEEAHGIRGRRGGDEHAGGIRRAHALGAGPLGESRPGNRSDGELTGSRAIAADAAPGMTIRSS